MGNYLKERWFAGSAILPQSSLVGCNSDKVGSLDGGRARKIGRGLAVAPASWSAGSPLPLWQCAWQRLASILIATPSVGAMRKALMVNGTFRGQGAIRLAKAAEDCPHSKTLARLSETPLGSITTVMRKLFCYGLLGQHPGVCACLNALFLPFFKIRIRPRNPRTFFFSRGQLASNIPPLCPKASAVS